MAKPKKTSVKVVLKRLYKIEVFRNDTEKEVSVDWDQSIPIPRCPGDYGYKNIHKLDFEVEMDYDFISSGGDGIILTDKLFEIYKQYKDLYDEVRLEMNTWDEYLYYPEIVGKRLETDEEFAVRLKKAEQKKVKEHEAKEEKKIKREEKKKQKELAQYEELKKKFEGE